MSEIISTISFRANLLNKCLKYTSRANDIINKWIRLSDEAEKLRLDDELSELILSARLSGLVTAVETLLNDILANVYVAYPLKLGKKTITVQDLNSSGTYIQAIKNIANSAVNEISYKSFRDYWVEWQNIVAKLPKISEDQINQFSEVKATRDLYVHNNGMVNELYLRKAGDKAREQKNSKVPLSQEYLDKVSELSIFFIETIKEGIIIKFGHCTKESVFREMWDATCCGKMVNFDTQWEVSKQPYHRKDYTWGWSSSEKAVFDFFLTIFHRNSEDISTDINYALYRWSSETSTGKVLRSWLESPFYI